MTERLYYTDAHLQEFDAAVTRVEPRDGRTAVFLDRTAFYPTSGGQPFDLGTIESARVIDVIDEDRDIAHIVDGAVPPGARVHGVIDWTRRFDHMQQHTGQHVLSAAFDRLFNARTVSFHLGAEASTIDLSRELTAQQLAQGEAEANRIVWENHAVGIRYASAEEAAALPLRKESAREGTLRLIDIDGFDLSACGGTHVSRTGAIGVIALGGVERFKGGQRVEFFCGGRALKKWRAMRDALAGAVRVLSVLPDALPQAIEKLQAESRARQKAIASLQQDLAQFQAREFAADAEQIPAGRLVARAIDADANGLKSLASAITSAPGFIAVLASASQPALVVVARSADVSVAANQVLSGLTAKFGGRGGGKPDLAQAGGLNADASAILAAARLLVTPGI
ncbi:MAG TPA: DHHA1 domain-containing protein [Vicinamibacterales bacterium]|nr:DHHA1 domain-containing protein [Vicinamibacterales bacterium]